MKPGKLKQYFWVLCGLPLLLFSCAPPEFDISRVQAVSKLAALEVTLDKTLFAKKENRVLPFMMGGFKIGEASYMAHTQAILLVGIDAAKIQGKDVDAGAGSISLTLPPIELLDFSYPAERFYDDTLYTPNHKFSLEDKEVVYQQGEMEIRKMLPYLELEEKAQEKIKTLLRPILAEMGFERIQIDFHPSTDFVAQSQ